MSTAAADARIGALFDGRFKIARKIGSGGVSAVYLAKDSQGGKQVALKILDREGDNEVAVKRFLREIEVMQRLNHPNIVEVYGAGETADGELYLHMEVLKGRTLARQLKQHGPMEPERIIAIGKHIAEALHAAHSQRILHRDLKPSNIRLIAKGGSRDFVKVLDFAIAQFVEDDESEEEEQLTAVGKVVGTPHYMAPEQIASRQLDERCDLYALGCMLYEMATGRTPFVGKTFEVMRQHAFDKPPTVGSVSDRRIPRALEDLIMKLLEKAPEDRPPSASAVSNLLDKVAAAAAKPAADPGLSFDDLGGEEQGTVIPGMGDDAAFTSELPDDEPGALGGVSLALAGFGGVMLLGGGGLLIAVFLGALFFL